MRNMNAPGTARRTPARWALPLLLLWLLVPVGAQEGVGVVREGTTTNTQSLNEFNPLLCGSMACSALNRYLAPTFGYADPLTGRWEPAVTGSNALATGWSQSADGRDYTFALRDDLTWRDGQPVTAYDVLFTLTALFQPETETAASRFGFAAPDARTLVITQDEPQCDVVRLLSLPVVPYHPFAPDFRAVAEATITGETAQALTAAWTPQRDNYQRADMRNQPFSLDPLTTNESAYTLSGVRVGAVGEIRLDGAGGRYAYVLATTPDPLESFLRGEVNYLDDVPYQRVGDVESVGGTVVSQPGRVVYALALNFADPTEARPFDTDDEDGQGVHPVWGDRRVRQAAAHAIDVGPLVETGLYGHATPVNSLAPPDAWYVVDDLPRPAYNRTEAERLLTAAGWRATTPGSTRACVTCATAPPGSDLLLTLGYSDTSDLRARVIAEVLAGQLRAVGFEVNVVAAGGFQPQSLDATLVLLDAGYPYAPEAHFRRFRTTEDTVDANGTSGANITSYSNPRVDDLLTRAATMPNCADYSQRAAFYQDAQRQIVAEDIAYIPLLAPHDRYAVARGVRGFAPLPNAPQWNMTDWIITEGGNP